MKHIFVGGRHSGKTTAIIEWLREDPTRGVIVRNLTERSIYLEAGVSPQQLLTSYQAVRGRTADYAVERDDGKLGRTFQHLVVYG